MGPRSRNGDPATKELGRVPQRMGYIGDRTPQWKPGLSVRGDTGQDPDGDLCSENGGRGLSDRS